MPGPRSRGARWAPAFLLACVATATLARSEPVELYAAGSLRVAVTELAEKLAADYSIEVKPTFGSSGSLRERIERGEHPDLFLSADLGSPRTLASQNRTLVPTIPFARNRMCIVSRRSAHVTQSNFLDRMLSPNIRLKTSTPVADPSGDYAWAIFDRIEATHPGKGAVLKDKASKLMTLTATPSNAGQSPAVALFASGQIDMSITYCSAVAGLLKESPELASLEVPPQLEPHPVYGLATLSTRPEALRVALFILSEKGQKIIADAGLLPVLEVGAANP